MQVKEIKSEGLSHELEVTIPANDIDARVEAKLKEAGQTMSLPGFRPGKVPLAMLKKRYGKAIMGEVLEAAVNETSTKVMADKKLRPALQPKIEVKTFDDGKDLVYTMALETLPDFKLTDFKKIKLVKPVAKVTDKETDDALERIAANNTSTQEVTTKRGAKDGDTIVIDFHGRTADDNVEHEGMHAHGHNLTLGAGQFIPGFEDQLIGKKAGDDVEVKVKFPDEYGAEHLSGRDAIFDVKIHEIREAGEAKIDDELAKTLGLEDLPALKKAIAEQLEKEFESHSRLNLKKDLLDRLDELHDFEIPAGMLEMEYNNILQQIELDNQREGKDKELSDDEKAEFKEISERRVRLGLILAEVGQQNKINIAEAELHKAVIAEAQKFPGQEKEVFDYYSKNPQALDSLRAPLFEEKVADFIIELASITEKEVTPEELVSALNEDEDEAESKPKKKKPAAKKTPAKSETKKPAAKKKAPTKKPAAKKKAD